MLEKHLWNSFFTASGGCNSATCTWGKQFPIPPSNDKISYVQVWQNSSLCFEIVFKGLRKWNKLTFLSYKNFNISGFVIGWKHRCSIKEVFWKTSENSQINTRSSHREMLCQKMFLTILQNSQKNNWSLFF